MKLPPQLAPWQRAQQSVHRAAMATVRKLGAAAYLVLAAVFSLTIIASPNLLGFMAAAETRLFDLLISNRLIQPFPDSDIVILDIDEASLAAMAPQFGRWPWPNSVLGEMVTAIEAQKPRAIVFDILFSDRDTLRPESDAAFDAAIAASQHTFFPMLRLDPQNDHLSRIRPGMLPGAKSMRTPPDDEATIAVILPKVAAAIDNGRLGSHQVTPDRDGVIRRYPAWLEHAGWQIPSLPQRIASELGLPTAAQREVLINWRGPPFSYRYESFAEVYRNLKHRKPGSIGSDFTGKIVIIGSTAPSLFDIKGTPMARIHPGVEILATAIDNFIHADWLHERPPWLMKLATLVLIWSMAFALYRQIRVEVFDSLFVALQGVLILMAFYIVNLSDWYLDTSTPLSLGFMYFTVARLYHRFSWRWLANGQAQDLEALPQGQRLLGVLAVHLDAGSLRERRRLKSQLDRLVARSRCGAGRITDLVEDPGFVRAVFADVMLIYWLSEDIELNWEAEAMAFTKRLENSQPRLKWSHRLSFGRRQSILIWNEPGAWNAQARSVILAAINEAAGGTQELSS